MGEPKLEGAESCPPHNVLEGAPQRDPQTGKVRIFKCLKCGKYFSEDELTAEDMEDGEPIGDRDEGDDTDGD